MQLRTTGLKHNVFIGMSSGYDSGAIALSLGLLGRPYLAYSMAGTEDMDVLHQRSEKLGENWTLLAPTSAVFSHHTQWLRKHIEKYHNVLYSATNVSSARSPWTTIPSDRAAIGLSIIISHARPRAGLVYVSGAGADEIISDYSVGPGACVMPGASICNFDGRFPANLSEIFPHVWVNFYEGAQRGNLMREELTAGARGVEGRYPFLDGDVVQEYLWLSQPIKNSEYKRPVADFLRRHNFPNNYKWKSGFNAFADTRAWKKINKETHAQERKDRRYYVSGWRRNKSAATWCKG